MGKNVTIADLARELGLAKSAVSYALNDQPGVSEETRLRVKQHAVDRGWRPSSVARALSGGKAGAIGIVLNREPMLLAEEPWYQLVIAGVEDVLIDADVSLMLRMVGMRGRDDRDTYRQWAQERRVDGVLLFDGKPRDPRLPLLQKLGLPAVLVGFRKRGFASVSGDGQLEAELLVDHLAERGARSILFVGGDATLASEGRRREGMAAACGTRGIRLTIGEGGYSMPGGREAVELALRDPSIDGVVCSNDLMAVGALAGLEDAGKRVPDDVLLASWDYSALTRSSRPELTALDRDAMGVGRQAARVLLDQIAGESSRLDSTLAPTLVPAGTT